MYVKEYMSTNVITVNSDTLFHTAEEIMRGYRIRRLPVVDKGKLVGLVTEGKLRELAPPALTRLSVRELDDVLEKITVKDVMEKELFTVTPDTTVEQASSEAQKRGAGTILVVDKDKPNKLVGIATTTDLYKIIVGILGFGQPGIRLHVFEPDKVGSTREVVDIINKQGAKILSLFHVTPPQIGRKDCIIHLDTENASQIIGALKSKGYEVEARPR